MTEHNSKISSYGSIVMPSPHSTDASSRENVHLLAHESSDEDDHGSPSNNGGGVSEIQLKSFRSNIGATSFYEWVTNKGARRRWSMITCALFLLVVLAAAAWAALWYTNSRSSPSGFGPSAPVVPKGPPYRGPLSMLDPVTDLGLADYDRPKDSRIPSTLHKLADEGQRAFPTNAWYQNMIMAGDQPSEVHRAYVIPYVVDAAGPIPGLRVHPNHVGSTQDVVQVYVVEEYGLTVGAASDASRNHTDKPLSQRYYVKHATNMGVTLEWDHHRMHSPIVKGMPYATMVYDKSYKGDLLPTIASQVALGEDPRVDGGKTTLDCRHGTPTRVKRDLELLFGASDFTWLVFFSEPVEVQCLVDPATGGLLLQVVDYEDEDAADQGSLVIRAAIYKSCTSGQSPIWCHQEQMHPNALWLGQGEYGDVLRSHAHLYPGPNTSFAHDVYEANQTIRMVFDWDVQDMADASPAAVEPKTANKSTPVELITFALPHHFDLFHPEDFTTSPDWTDRQIYCTASVVGPACLVESSAWTLMDHLPDVSLRASRPPAPWAIEHLANSLRGDIQFTLPAYFLRGAGDTYFSGKMLAKLGRILLIDEELREICDGDVMLNPDYAEKCETAQLPTEQERENALQTFRSAVEIWLNGSATTPFVFDASWGGVVSCGCDFQHNDCANRFPECPAFSDPGLNFGNGFYNDMHFHYGYHIYAAAIAAHFDHVWGMRFFEPVLSLIRTIANPSEEDTYFVTWRHKDWYQGHSWASGIAVSPMNGKNQESSSESIAAYEAVALYGDVMATIWNEARKPHQTKIAVAVRSAGQALVASELRAAKTYWHISHSPDQTVKILPASYKYNVVGILWQTMAQFQTWFGSAPYLVYGIQLLPFTPIAEQRDGLEWSKEMYRVFADSCETDKGCNSTGWAVLQMGMLARVGHHELAMDKTMAMTPDMFDGPAGDGHSLSNTLWFIATRPHVDEPLQLKGGDSHMTHNTTYSPDMLTDCGRPDTCTPYVLDTIAGLYSCRQRIQWLIRQRGKTQEEACAVVAGVEHIDPCGPCDPAGAGAQHEATHVSDWCPPCTPEECASDLNRCPRYERTFVCAEGNNVGGCAGYPWNINGPQCSRCCELSSCPPTSALAPPAKPVSGNADDCPPCSHDVCHSRVNQCPKNGAAPFLCYDGAATGGCSPEPWLLKSGPCKKCCTVTECD